MDMILSEEEKAVGNLFQKIAAVLNEEVSPKVHIGALNVALFMVIPTVEKPKETLDELLFTLNTFAKRYSQ